jgi:hypothetical protein
MSNAQFSNGPDYETHNIFEFPVGKCSIALNMLLHWPLEPAGLGKADQIEVTFLNCSASRISNQAESHRHPASDPSQT